MRKRAFGGVAALLFGCLTLVGVAGAHTVTRARTAVKSASVHYYLALGDSLSVGYQPNATTGVGHETTQGYVNDLYASARKTIKNLKLVELGCPGETTTSMLTGKGNTTEAKAFKCDRSGGSQLKAAEAFLRAHSAKGEVPLITLDIGANDVDGCVADSAEGTAAVEGCAIKGVDTIEANTPKILAAIRHAAAKGTTLAAMNLYDPVLADELSSDQSAQSLGTLSLSLVQSINSAIAKADRASHFLTADVAKAFNTYDTTPVSTAGTPLAATGMSTVPTDVAEICTLTWMCAASPVGPNIHTNQQGYADIAKAFEAVLPKSV